MEVNFKRDLPVTSVTRLVSWWKFDGNLEDSVGENDGDASGVGNDANTNGNVLNLDGEGDYVKISPLNNWPAIGTKDFSISAWINPSVLIGDYRMILVDNVLNNFQFNLDNNGNSAKMEMFLLNNPPTTSNALTWNLGQWYYIAVIRESEIVKFYRDGIYIGGGTDSDSVVASTYLDIGYRTSNNMHPFNGSIDDVMVFNRSLSAEEITAIYNNQKQGKI